MADFSDDFIGLLLNFEEANLDLPDPKLVQYYNDLKNRIIWIDTEINDATLDLISKIVYWNKQDQDLEIDARKPIKIYFNCPGGSLDVE